MALGIGKLIIVILVLIHHDWMLMPTFSYRLLLLLIYHLISLFDYIDLKYGSYPLNVFYQLGLGLYFVTLDSW